MICDLVYEYLKSEHKVKPIFSFYGIEHLFFLRTLPF